MSQPPTLNIALKKNQTAHTLEVLESQKAKLNNELHKISSEIKKLREIKLSEHNQILELGNLASKSNQVATASGNKNLESAKKIIYKEIESAENRKNEIALETFKFQKKLDELNKKIIEVNQVKNSLIREIEKKKEEISILIGRKKAISLEQNDDISSALLRQNEEKLKLAEDIQARINQLRNQESVIIDSLTDKRNELRKLDKQIEEKIHLNRSEVEIKNSLKQFSFDESARAPPGCSSAKSSSPEPPPLQQRKSKRIAHGHCCRGAGGRYQPQRAGFLRNADINHHVPAF